MKDFDLFVIGITLTFIFAGLTGYLYWRIKVLKELRTLHLGRLTLLFLISCWITSNGILGTVIVGSYKHSGLAIVLLAFEFGMMGLITLLIGILIPIAILILTVKMWRNEAKSIGNLLLPIVMFFFAGIDWLYLAAGRLSEQWLWLSILSFIFPILSLYLAWQFIIFFLASWVYGRKMRKNRAPYFVVLGAGLVAGRKVGILLANRIKAALKAADETTIIIFSGGQGKDEKVSEAFAMQEYAVNECHFPSERTLLEEQSKTTYENLVFSSRLIEKTNLTAWSNSENPQFLFFTSDYHVFRAALFAAKLKLTAQGGRGGKTAMYYRAPAFIREFIAVMNIERKKQVLVFSAIVLLCLVAALITAFLQYKNHFG